MGELESNQMKRILAIEVIVSDIKRAERWYRRCLGAKVVKYYRRWKCIEVILGDSTVELDIGEPLRNWGKQEYQDGLRRIGSVTGINIEVDDIEHSYRMLRKRGVKFIVPPTKKAWGEAAAVFVDPDGNSFKMVQKS